MAHWTTKLEQDEEINNLVVFIDDKGNQFETMFDAPDHLLEMLNQGNQLTSIEKSAINWLSGFYPLEVAIDVVTAFRFKTKDDIIDARFMLAPSLDEVRDGINLLDSTDIKDLLSCAGISGRGFAKKIQALESTIRNRLNHFKSKSVLSFAEKYLAKVLN